MPRCHGSYIGHVPEPTASATSGIWKACDAQELLLDGKWPSQPAVPGAPTGVPGTGRVVLTWAALTTSPTVTDYGIQYSDDAGATWTTFTDSVSSATTATVTGLTNGAEYVFRLYGINALGDGPYGSSSAAVTPGAAPIPAILLHFDGADGSTTFTDFSPNALPVAAGGGAEISTAESKFGGASLALDGSAFVSTTAPITLGAGSFTVEAWVFVDSESSGTRPIASAYDLAPTPTPFAKWLFYVGGDGTLSFLAENAAQGQWTLGCVGAEVPTDEWVHVAVTRSNGSLRLFVGGVEDTHSVSNAGLNIPPADITAVGKLVENGAGAAHFAGYIDEFRILIGTAAYTANFTPPPAPFEFSVTSLLLNFNGSNNSTSFTDSSSNALTVTPYGGAVISTAQSKFGGASGLFGRDSYLVGPENSNPLNFDGIAGTVECWLRLTEHVGVNNFLTIATPADRAGTTGLSFGLEGATTASYPSASYTDVGISFTKPTALSLNVWHHIAWVIDNDGVTLRIFLNGQQVEQVTLTGSQQGSGFVIGNDIVGMPVLPTAYYIDDLRVTRGEAVYTANFTPPTAPH